MLYTTCGPDAMDKLFTSDRAAALQMSWVSRHRSATELPQNAPGTSSYDALKYGLRPIGSGLTAALMTQWPTTQPSIG